MKKEKNNRQNVENEISHLGKIFLFFKSLKERFEKLKLVNRTVEKQKELAGYEGAESPAETKISLGFWIARIIAIILLSLILVLSLIFGGRIISYDNVYYMFKDIGYVNSFNESMPQTLSYSNPLTNQDFACFKGGLAVVGDSEFKFFTSSGRATLTQGSEYSDPKICTSDSYALIYDRGNRRFSVYNSFVSLYSETLDFPISSAHMADNGSFCIVTKNKNYGSCVKTYGNDFKLISEYSKNDYIISAEMSANGKYMVVLSLDSENGSAKTMVDLVQIGKEELKFSVELMGVMPYSASFISKDRIVLISKESAVVFDLNGNVKNEYNYTGSLMNADVTDKGFLLSFDETSTGKVSLVSVFDVNGHLKRSFKTDDAVFDMKLSGDFVYLLCDREIRRYNLNSVSDEFKAVPFDEESAKLAVFEEGDIMACTPTVAYYISFN